MGRIHYVFVPFFRYDTATYMYIMHSMMSTISEHNAYVKNRHENRRLQQILAELSRQQTYIVERLKDERRLLHQALDDICACSGHTEHTQGAFNSGNGRTEGEHTATSETGEGTSVDEQTTTDEMGEGTKVDGHRTTDEIGEVDIFQEPEFCHALSCVLKGESPVPYIRMLQNPAILNIGQPEKSDGAFSDNTGSANRTLHDAINTMSSSLITPLLPAASAKVRESRMRTIRGSLEMTSQLHDSPAARASRRIRRACIKEAERMRRLETQIKELLSSFDKPLPHAQCSIWCSWRRQDMRTLNHRSPVGSNHKETVIRNFIVFFYVVSNCWTNGRVAGDFRRHRANIIRGVY